MESPVRAALGRQLGRIQLRTYTSLGLKDVEQISWTEKKMDIQISWMSFK
jgi:hypothetical protein